MLSCSENTQCLFVKVKKTIPLLPCVIVQFINELFFYINGRPAIDIRLLLYCSVTRLIIQQIVCIFLSCGQCNIAVTILESDKNDKHAVHTCRSSNTRTINYFRYMTNTNFPYECSEDAIERWLSISYLL